jgi:S1-C subfamily serine protease
MLKFLSALALASFAVGALLALIVTMNTPAYGGLHSDATVVKVSLLPNGHGTGVYIGNGKVLTAAHVAKEGVNAGFTVKDARGAEVHAVVLWFNEVADVGLLKLDGPFIDKDGVVDVLPAAKLACDTPDVKIGDYVETIGYPLALDRIHTWGHVASDISPREAGQLNFLTDLTIAPGNSGGPLFDINGKLAGITVAMSLAPINAGFGVIPSFVMLTYVIPKSVICQELAAEHAAPVKAEPTTEGTP